MSCQQLKVQELRGFTKKSGFLKKKILKCDALGLQGVLLKGSGQLLSVSHRLRYHSGGLGVRVGGDLTYQVSLPGALGFCLL